MIFSWLLARKFASPVASASSIIKISWLLAEAMEKRSRWAIPVEYVRIG